MARQTSRSRWESLLVAAAILVGASAAQAAARPFKATLEIRVNTLQPLVVFGAGTAIVNGSAGGSHLDSLSLAGSTFATLGAVVPVTDPAVLPIVGLVLTVHNGAGGFANNGGAIQGVMPLFGVTKVCLFGASCASASTNLSVPITVVGQGGQAAAAGAVNLTIAGAPWTIGTAAIGTITEMGSARGPGSATSSTVASGGQLKLVTPIFVSTNIGASAIVPVFGILTLHFVPEPGTIVLLAAGIGLLGLNGHARRRG